MSMLYSHTHTIETTEGLCKSNTKKAQLHWFVLFR